MDDDLLPKLVGWGRHPGLWELRHFEVEAWGERILVHKTADGKWKAGTWKTIEEIADEGNNRREPPHPLGGGVE